MIAVPSRLAVSSETSPIRLFRAAPCRSPRPAHSRCSARRRDDPADNLGELRNRPRSRLADLSTVRCRPPARSDLHAAISSGKLNGSDLTHDAEWLLEVVGVGLVVDLGDPALLGTHRRGEVCRRGDRGVRGSAGQVFCEVAHSGAQARGGSLFATVDVVPIVPLAAEHALGIAVVSYAGAMTFGLCADRGRSRPRCPHRRHRHLPGTASRAGAHHVGGAVAQPHESCPCAPAAALA